MDPRMRKRHNQVRVQRLLESVREQLDLPTPNSDAEGSSVDHDDHPPVPIGGGVEDLESFENEGGSCGYEDKDQRYSEDDDD